MNSKVKILILQHNPDDTDLLKAELQRSFTNCTAHIVHTKKDFEDALHDFNPNIILSDYSLPAFEWNDAFELKQKVAPAVPFILISEAIGEEAVVELIKTGITDYALKNKPASLAPKIVRALKEAEEHRQKTMEQESLRKSILNLRAIFEHTDVGFLFLNTAYKVVAYNYICSHWAANIFGAELKEGANLKKLLQPDRLAEFDAFGKTVLAGNTISYETSYPKTDGSVMWLIVTGKPVVNDGKTVGLCIALTDITTQKLAAEELKHSASRLKQAQAIAHMGNWELDLATGTALWSSEVCRIYGRAPEEFMQAPDAFLSFVHPDDLGFVTKTINDSRTSLLDTSFYHRIIRRDGVIRHIHTERRYEFDAQGVPKGLHGISQDITEIKEMENELRKSETSIRTIFENTDIGFLLMDLDYNVVAVNAKAEQWSKNLLLLPMLKGMNLRANLPRERVDEFDRQMAKLKHGGQINYEIHYPDSKGKLSWFQVNGKPVAEIGGKVVGVCLSLNNITERKDSENEIKELNENLEERVLERTAELSEANKALEAFSYSVSHDLRAPVRAVLSFSKIIENEYGAKMEPEVKELFGYIEDSGNRMRAIIDDLLKLAKYGQEKLKPEPVNMKQMVKAAWANISRTAPHHALLELGELPVIQADMSMMEQVVINLLSNAIKYSAKKEKPVLKVGYEPQEKRIVFYFKDNGAGFDMESYDRLFGAFQRLHSAGEFEGTGIGLMLVKRIIDKHGGEVWAEGKVDEGATFYFSIPILQPVQQL